MLAASAASASPSVSTFRKSSGPPAPPDAITGMRVARETARVRSQSNPCLTPSVSIDVSRISPAPNSSPRAAHSTASIPSSTRPPLVKTFHPPPGLRRASIARTTACAPNSLLIAVISSGFRTADVLMPTLSAPAISTLRASTTDRNPPPTVSGMKTFRAVRATMSTMVLRLSLDAVISRNTISSAPCWL